VARRHGPRARAGATALAVSIAAGLCVALTTVAPDTSAMQLKSERARSQTWAQKYNHRLVELVNKRRAAHGLRKVRVTPCAGTWARRWSHRLDARDAFVHSDLGRLLARCHANYASENLAMIYDGARPADVVKLWMRSPGHRANILSRKARFTGISVRWDASQHAWVAVQNFVRR
jgi:uncharacterized protein YkwD